MSRRAIGAGNSTEEILRAANADCRDRLPVPGADRVDGTAVRAPDGVALVVGRHPDLRAALAVDQIRSCSSSTSGRRSPSRAPPSPAEVPPLPPVARLWLGSPTRAEPGTTPLPDLVTSPIGHVVCCQRSAPGHAPQNPDPLAGGRMRAREICRPLCPPCGMGWRCTLAQMPGWPTSVHTVEPEIFSSAEASPSGYLVYSAPEASARYSLFRETA